jgi:GldM C-terminal domain
LENFDFDARCSIQSFELIISPKKGEIFKTIIVGGVFSEEIKKRFQALEVGDVVNIFEIKTRCPGDPIARGGGSLTYTMK